ncbi:MAG: sulfotransferase family protein [Deltaproteobacteria bacterium]|nr:MAG: sulfotransferase family protein [Deltaproteobacteria bacterium]
MTRRNEPITIVSGLPRSGTSLMMQMLHRGGLPVLSDGERTADDDNPRGYFELEAVKATARDASWVAEAEGKVVKVISELLPHLPADRTYRVIFMRRRLDEVLASQRRMLQRRGEPLGDDDAMRSLFARHVERAERFLRDADHMTALYVSYNRLVADPAAQAARVAAFLGGIVDPAAMAAAVDPSLYRNRTQ